ncbi:pheromone-processing carboxypeptidase KEX isoform X1 [Spatholobus suberectus]|nr:pheromone-processing carboxypeptidase KEX isoform X1 [Spatholobus suberectus]
MKVNNPYVLSNSRICKVNFTFIDSFYLSGAGMEPSGAEECHSSESGWTMYIGSPVDDDGHSDDGDNDNSDDEGTQAHPQDDDDESDDSMASDASSGPSHHGVNHGFADFQRAAKEEYDENNLDKKANKTQHKLIMEGKKVEKKGMLFIDSKGKSPVKEGGKICCDADGQSY